MSLVLTNYAHFLGLAGLFAALAVELALFAPRVDGAAARRLARVDALYGLSALVALGTGLLKLFAGSKPAAYFGVNPLFHVKMTLFVVVLLLAVYPAVHFFKRRRTPPGQEAVYPRAIGVLLRVELALLLVMPLLAVLMARGYGYGG